MELGAHDRACGIDLHQARLDEPIDPRVQAADARRQLRRKHVNGALREIHRRRTLVAFQIERAAFGHVVGDVGDVDAQPVVAVRQHLEADRVVEIARVLAVDGDRHGRTEIRAPDDVFGADRHEPESLFDGGLAVRVGNAVLADDDLGVDALLVDIAEHLDDLPDRAARGGGPRRDLHEHHLAPLGRTRLPGRHVHVARDPSIEGLHETEARVVDVETADDRRVPAREHADDASIDAVVARPALDAREHAIAVHRLLDVHGGDVHVGCVAARLVGHDKAVAGRVHLQAAHDEIHFVRQPHAAALGLHELARGCQRLDEASKRRAFFPGNFQNSEATPVGVAGCVTFSRSNLTICSLDSIES